MAKIAVQGVSIMLQQRDLKSKCEDGWVDCWPEEKTDWNTCERLLNQIVELCGSESEFRLAVYPIAVIQG